MKRAVGELSSTVIVVISVAILVAFFYYPIWPMMNNNFKSQTSCDNAVCNTKTLTDGKVECTVPGEPGTFWCNFKG
jgi:hypothetical protein